MPPDFNVLNFFRQASKMITADDPCRYADNERRHAGFRMRDVSAEILFSRKKEMYGYTRSTG